MTDRHNMVSHLINENNHLAIENNLLHEQNRTLLLQIDTYKRLAEDLSVQVGEYQGIVVVRKAS